MVTTLQLSVRCISIANISMASICDSIPTNTASGSKLKENSRCLRASKSSPLGNHSKIRPVFGSTVTAGQWVPSMPTWLELISPNRRSITSNNHENSHSFWLLVLLNRIHHFISQWNIATGIDLRNFAHHSPVQRSEER